MLLAEAAVQAGYEDSEPRERVARTARDPKKGQTRSSGSAQEKRLGAARPTESRRAIAIRKRVWRHLYPGPPPPVPDAARSHSLRGPLYDRELALI